MISTNGQSCPDSTSVQPAASLRPHQYVRCLFAVFYFLSFVSQAEAGLRIYYLRHAEAGHNVVKEWANVPKAQWPAYVGHDDKFTPKGETQVAAATAMLEKDHFDFIAVSPMWRAMHTVLPYLKATGAKAEIWPELREFSGGTRVLSTNLPPPLGQILNAGRRLKLSPDEAPYFTLREGATNDFLLPRMKGEQQQAAYRFVVEHEVDLIRKRFGGTTKAILLVGHANSGKALLKFLTLNNLSHTPPIANAELWMVEEQPDGRFKLEMYNDTPYAGHAARHARHSHASVF
jgi:broad specificity phosphatase PhoE